jgi:hypothetical protein
MLPLNSLCRLFGLLWREQQKWKAVAPSILFICKELTLIR